MNATTADAAALAPLVRTRATVEVPATIANLGAGFDCLGLAVDLRLRISLEARSRVDGAPPVELVAEGEDAGELVGDPANRTVLALMAALDELGVHGLKDVAWRLEVRNEIPLERGLGSSAAAAVA
ncbi:MAG TPA: hypothetical protein VJ506_00540, partial [Candidatus Limnocylindrales bacterium]|nr:hypothetical protein [Candidatus Limnocylindrales bacterium]